VHLIDVVQTPSVETEKRSREVAKGCQAQLTTTAGFNNSVSEISELLPRFYLVDLPVIESSATIGIAVSAPRSIGVISYRSS
jgi:hypothetical protein